MKIDGLAIIKASVENRGGWTDLKDVSLRIGGDKDNIKAIRLLAQATGDFTKAELSKDGRLVLDRQSAALVQAAGGDPDGTNTTLDPNDEQNQGGTTPSGGNTPSGGTTPSGGGGSNNDAGGQD